jgi:hypothetical protein
MHLRPLHLGFPRWAFATVKLVRMMQTSESESTTSGGLSVKLVFASSKIEGLPEEETLVPELA